MRTFQLVLLLLAAAGLSAQNRDSIPRQYKWNLEELYPTDSSFNASRIRLSKRIPGLAAFRGGLTSSPSQLAAGLGLFDSLNLEFARLYTYATLRQDQDLRDQNAAAAVQAIDLLGTNFEQAAAFIEPEILGIDSASLPALVSGDPRLADFRGYLSDIFRRKTHLRSDGEEEIIAMADLMTNAPMRINDQLLGADIEWTAVTRSDGSTIKMDREGYLLLRQSNDREERRLAQRTYFHTLNKYGNVAGALLLAQVSTDIFAMRTRGYSTCLESALDRDQIPMDLFRSLIDNVNRSLPTLHRYLRLRQRILGIDTMHYYDLTVPLAPEADRKYTIDEARKLVLAAIQPLGREYIGIIEGAFRERWIDFCPSTGKRSGGHTNGWAYAVHPYTLINFSGSYSDVEGLAHELGHGVHYALANSAQPFVAAVPPRFVVEVSPLLNENMLLSHMTRDSGSDDQKLNLLGNYLDGFALKIFRATLISEFELRIHELAESGEQLTGKTLDSLYLKLTRRYYGEEEGICTIDDEIKSDWVQLPQLYHEFYAYQYAVAFTAASALAEDILSGDRAARERYLAFLTAGGSVDATNLLRKAGVDMTGAAPFQLSLRNMNRALDELERLLERRK